LWFQQNTGGVVALYEIMEGIAAQAVAGADLNQGKIWIETLLEQALKQEFVVIALRVLRQYFWSCVWRFDRSIANWFQNGFREPLT